MAAFLDTIFIQISFLPDPILAVHVPDGRTLWTWKGRIRAHQHFGAVADEDGIAFWGTPENEEAPYLVYLSRLDGRELWRVPVPGFSSYVVGLTNGDLLTADNDEDHPPGHLLQIDPRAGRVRSSLPTIIKHWRSVNDPPTAYPEGVSIEPSEFGGFSRGDNWLFLSGWPGGYSGETMLATLQGGPEGRAVSLRHYIGGGRDRRMSADSNHIYFVDNWLVQCMDVSLHAVWETAVPHNELARGQVNKEASPLPDIQMPLPVLTPDRLIVSTWTHVYALSLTSGHILWSADTHTEQDTSEGDPQPLAVGDVLYIATSARRGDTRDTITAYSLKTGKVLGSTNVILPIRSFIAHRGHLYVLASPNLDVFYLLELSRSKTPNTRPPVHTRHRPRRSAAAGRHHARGRSSN